MQNGLGIWIDHKRALLVWVAEGTETREDIPSNLERHTRLAGGSPAKTPWGPQDVAAERRRERRYQLHCERYYDRVALRIRTAERIFLAGPGVAKHEFHKHLKRYAGIENRITAVETLDKMTDRQFAARVREHFEREGVRA